MTANTFILIIHWMFVVMLVTFYYLAKSLNQSFMFLPFMYYALVCIPVWLHYFELRRDEKKKSDETESQPVYLPSFWRLEADNMFRIFGEKSVECENYATSTPRSGRGIAFKRDELNRLRKQFLNHLNKPFKDSANLVQPVGSDFKLPPLDVNTIVEKSDQMPFTDLTKIQIAAIMLLHGTPEQREQGIEFFAKYETQPPLKEDHDQPLNPA